MCTVHQCINAPNRPTFAENVAIFLCQQARIKLLVTQQTSETQHVVHLQHTHRQTVKQRSRYTYITTQTDRHSETQHVVHLQHTHRQTVKQRSWNTYITTQTDRHSETQHVVHLQHTHRPVCTIGHCSCAPNETMTVVLQPCRQPVSSQQWTLAGCIVHRRPHQLLLDRESSALDWCTPERPLECYCTQTRINVSVLNQQRSSTNCTSSKNTQHRQLVYINYSKTTKTTYCFIDVSASRRKPSSGLTSGAGRQYVKACLIRVAQLVAPLVSIHVVGLPAVSYTHLTLPTILRV